MPPKSRLKLLRIVARASRYRHPNLSIAMIYAAGLVCGRKNLTAQEGAW